MRRNCKRERSAWTSRAPPEGSRPGSRPGSASAWTGPGGQRFALHGASGRGVHTAMHTHSKTILLQTMPPRNGLQDVTRLIARDSHHPYQGLEGLLRLSTDLRHATREPFVLQYTTMCMYYIDLGCSVEFGRRPDFHGGVRQTLATARR